MPGRKRRNCVSVMNREPCRPSAPNLPHICAKMRKQKKAKPSSPCGASFSLTTTKFAGTFSACKNWPNSKSTLSESIISVWYFGESRIKDGTTSGFVRKMCSKARSCLFSSKPGASSSRNSVSLPSAWMAMKVIMASTTSSVCKRTVSFIHSCTQAQDCCDKRSSTTCARTKAPSWSFSSQNTDSIAQYVCICRSSALAVKYESSGYIFGMRALKGRSDRCPANNSFANCRPLSASSFSTTWLVTGIHIFGSTTASYSFLRDKSKGKSWKVTEPPKVLAKIANCSKRMLSTALELFRNSLSADW
mmetsp:Transcript_28286/g.85256  ORF Transcript_28286/g.85256 Transcript_28286/m.85256 type:complete len:304 (-) Transcript_28286:4114-5025(-)